MKTQIKELSSPTERQAFWQDQLLQWTQSGIGQKQFCQQRGLSPHVLTWWKAKYRDELNLPYRAVKKSSGKNSKNRFVEVKVFSNGNRIVNKFNGLLNFRFFDWLTIAYIAAVATISVKRNRLVNLILPEWLSIAAFMTGLTTLVRGTAGLFGFGWLDNIRGRRLGRIGGIHRKFGDLFGKLSYLFSKFGVGFKKFGNLLFKLSNELNVELFFLGSQFSSSSHLLWLLSCERGPPLKKNRYCQLVLRA